MVAPNLVSIGTSSTIKQKNFGHITVVERGKQTKEDPLSMFKTEGPENPHGTKFGYLVLFVLTS